MPKKVLVIDDEEDILSSIDNILKRHGYEVLMACNGEEGLESFKFAEPDLVITDVLMPKKEGIETILGIKGIDPNAKIIVMSGGSNYIESEKILALAAECDVINVLKKPFSIEELVGTVDKCFED